MEISFSIAWLWLDVYHALLCGLQGVPVAKKYQMWSDIMIISFYY